MKHIGRIILISKPLYKLFAVQAFLILATVLLELVPPLLLKQAVDTTLGSLDSPSFLNTASYLLLIFLISSLASLLSTISNRLGDHVAGSLNEFLTNKFYKHVLSLPQSYFDSEISGKIVNQLSRGISTIQGFSNTATNFIIPSVLQSILTIALLAYYSLPTAIFMACIFPVYYYFTKLSTDKWGKEQEKKNKHDDVLRGRIHEVLGNIKLVKSTNNQKIENTFVAKRLRTINSIYGRQSQTFHALDFMRNSGLNIILFGISLIIFYSASQSAITIGTVVLVIQLIEQARRPLYAMSFILTQVQNAETGSKEFFKIMDISETEKLTDLSFEQVVSAKIVFKNVSFAYEKGHEILDNISFEALPKQKIALVGHSGAGKTTITNLLLKLYEPTSGEILLNDQSYQKLSPQIIRGNISIVFQDNELFSTSIRENVAYGMKADDDQIQQALQKANALDFSLKLKAGIDTKIGERGVKLSGGQKQRIQIARAILANKPILILDEATSSLDSESEIKIQEALENLMQDRLVIIIAHRFSTIQNVDKIIVINNGKIVDQGTPRELAHKEGIYSKLLNYQIEGNKKLLKEFELY